MLRRIGCVALLVAVAGVGQARSDDLEEWRKQVSARLTSNKGWSPMPPSQSSTVRVGFVIDHTGKLVSDWLEDSTGIPALDTQALAIIERSQPFPMPPAGLDEGKLRMKVEFIFKPRPEGYHSFDEEQAALKAKMRTICRGC